MFARRKIGKPIRLTSLCRHNSPVIYASQTPRRPVLRTASESAFFEPGGRAYSPRRKLRRSVQSGARVKHTTPAAPAMDRSSFLIMDGSYLFKGSMRFRSAGLLDYQLLCKYLAEQVGVGPNADGFVSLLSHAVSTCRCVGSTR